MYTETRNQFFLTGMDNSSSISSICSVLTPAWLLAQGAIEEAVAALEYLLGSEPETIYKLAAGASAGLAGATQGRYMLRLLSPLAFLLSPSKTSLATASAAVAMQSILTTVRTRTADGQSVADDPVWKTLEDASVLKNIIWRLDKKNSNGLVGVAECAEILAIILERWPVARYRVGQMEAVRSSLLALCMNSTEAVAVSALRACSALGIHLHLFSIWR